MYRLSHKAKAQDLFLGPQHDDGPGQGQQRNGSCIRDNSSDQTPSETCDIIKKTEEHIVPVMQVPVNTGKQE